jgi:hypothetical protein
MTNDEIDIAIAEHLGAKWNYHMTHGGWIYELSFYAPLCNDLERWGLDKPPEKYEVKTRIPHYCTDLDVMYEVEEKAPFIYWHMLKMVTEYVDYSSYWENEKLLAHATARQRAEAYLKSIGKWK